MMNSYHIFLVL